MSNSYMNQMAAEAAALGVEKALLKVSCSPSILLGTINEVLAGKSGSEDSSQLLAAPKPSPPAAPPPPHFRPPRPKPPGPAARGATAHPPKFQPHPRPRFSKNSPGPAR